MTNKLRHAVWLRFGGRKRLERDLRRAAVNDNEALIIMTLIGMGARVDAPDPQTGRTPLMLAVTYGYRSNVVALMSHGADVHLKDKSGKSALDMAREQGLDGPADLLE